jgi:hypothetical protein
MQAEGNGETELHKNLQQLGLPTSFGTSKVIEEHHWHASRACPTAPYGEDQP